MSETESLFSAALSGSEERKNPESVRKLESAFGPDFDAAATKLMDHCPMKPGTGLLVAAVTIHEHNGNMAVSGNIKAAVDTDAFPFLIGMAVAERYGDEAGRAIASILMDLEALGQTRADHVVHTNRA